jgi:hypothetical protein
LIPTQPANTWQFQDNIPFDDPNPLGPPALSRPPSRIDRSAQDLSGEHASAASANVKTLREQEEQGDMDLQRAMAASLQDQHPGQENGVLPAGGTFGPAKRDHYDTNSWAMTTFSTSREIIEHPPPSKRRRIGDKPAFLRGAKDTGYLGSLLTIYHNIPLARAALMMPALTVHNYSHNPDWWSGHTDENNKALSTVHSTQINQHERNLLVEVQCLMAFLDRTNRAYGSVDALSELQLIRNRYGDGSVTRFLEAWTTSALKQAPEEQFTQIFGSVAMKADASRDAPIEKTLYCVEPYVNHKPDENLTDLLDNTIWDDRGGTLDDVWISHCAEIFTVRIQDPTDVSRAIGLTLEPAWYADRYMLECRDEMLQIRSQVQAVQRQIEQLTHLQRRCQFITLPPENRTLDIAESLTAALKVSEIVGHKSGALRDPRNTLQDPEDAVSEADLDELGSELKGAIQKIRTRVASLETRKETLQARQREIAMQFTKPTSERPDAPHRKYILQGAATKPGITYFRRNEPLVDLLEEGETDDTTHDKQWWRTTWCYEEPSKPVHPPMIGPATQAEAQAVENSSSDSHVPFSVDAVSEEEVLEAVKTESNSVILVFAHENAMKHRGDDLSLPLKYFVDRDNQAFEESIRNEEGAVPDLLIQRDDDEFEDVPLINTAGSSSSARELTPMSTSSADPDELEISNKMSIDSSNERPDLPPAYEDSGGKQEMQERHDNKIGLYAEQLLERYGGDQQHN